MTGNDAAPTIYLVDDDPGVLRALKRLLGSSGYGCETYLSAEAFLSRSLSEGTGCAVVDLQLPGVSGLDLQARLAQRDDAPPVIFLTGRGDVGSSVQAMKGGAVDFLEKPIEPAALLVAIESALLRDRERRERRRDRQEDERRRALLTPREREVLDLVVDGRLNKQIAAELGVAEKTVKVHRARVMRKFGVRTIADLVRLAVAPGS